MIPKGEEVITIGSLFAGVGGLELGIERAIGGRVVWQVEIDEWCRRVLAKHWPDAQRFADVRSVGAPVLAEVDLICGGFPCIDISCAGSRAGIDGDDSGLWFEFARIIGEVRPRVVVVENVAALLVRGLDRVLGSLAALGYDAIWDCIPAQAVGAPRRRDRIFVVAWRAPPVANPDRGRQQGERVARAPGPRWQRGERRNELDRLDLPFWPPPPGDLLAWGALPPDAQPALCRLADGFPAWMVRDRRRKLRAYGNSVVPQVAEAVGAAVAEVLR